MRFTCCFRWGGWTGYFGKRYLPEYDFSGGVTVADGKILTAERIVHPANDWGPFIFSPRFVLQEDARFASVLHNGVDGLRVTAECGEDSVWTLHTAMGDLAVTPRQLKEQGHIMREAGEKYSMAVLLAEPDEPWYWEPFSPEEQMWLPADFPGREQRDWFGVHGVLLRPGERLEWPAGVLAQPADPLDSAAMRVRLRFLLSAEPDREAPVRAVPRLQLRVGGNPVWQSTKFSMYHDVASQFLEEQWVEIPPHLLAEKGSCLCLENQDETVCVLVQRIGMRRVVRRHMAVVDCPSWGRQGCPAAVTIHVNQGALVDIAWDRETAALAVRPDTVSPRPYSRKMADLNTIGVNECALRALPPGDHTFSFVLLRPARDFTVTFTDRWTGRSAQAIIPEIWDAPEERDPVKVGVELQTGTPEEYIPLIRRIRDEQLGNLVVFRDYHNDSGQPDALWDAAAFCRHYGLYTDAIIMNDQATVAVASGDGCMGVGTHEHTGIFYGRDRVADRAGTMEEAASEAVSDLREVADALRIPGVPVSVGDASGGSRYAYEAGFDRIRHETFVGHHLLILPNARGAARAFGGREWGAHVASHHNALPELSFGLRRFWLGMALPWVMGARFVFEEDSLFSCFTDRRMTGQDYLPAGKQTINRWLYKYAATHPRQGEPLVDIAVMQGRYAPPVSGLSVANNGDTPDQAYADENYPVWSHTGRLQWEWGYRQPEKGLHLLEILAPGIFLTPLHQDTRRVRKFFSGCPKGEFDFLPVEAGAEVMRRYTLLLFLDWHTMSPDTDDYDKLLAYARQGGAVFLSVPHLTTRSDRDFLREMGDLRLYRQGDVSDLCGVRVRGKSQEIYSDAQWIDGWEDTGGNKTPLRLPNESPEEDGPCHLAEVEMAGAQVIARDAASGRPLLVRHDVGSGAVYLLCTWAYPGHEALQKVSAHIVDRLTDLHRRK